MSSAKPFKLNIICFLAFFFFISNSSSYSQKLTDADVKVVLVYNFIRYTTWINSQENDTFKIGTYGNDYLYTRLFKELEAKKAKGKIIGILPFEKVDDGMRNVDILFINFSANEDIKRIYKILKGTSVLLITDRYEDKREVMINFFHDNEDKVKFEINSKNIEDANLILSPNLLLLGGTELDVRELYKEAERSLIDEREKFVVVERELNNKKIEIDELNSTIDSLDRNIDILYVTIKQQLDNIEVQKNKLRKMENELSELSLQTEYQQKKLTQTNIVLNEKNSEFLRLDSLLSKKQKDLQSSNDTLNTLRKEILKTDLLLIKQNIKLQSQRTALTIFIAFIGLLLIFIIYIYRNNRIKQAKNIELEQKTERINQQKEQIQLQAQELLLANIDLERLSIVAEKTDNAVVIMNSAGEIEWVNEGFERMSGYKIEEFTEKYGKNFLDASTDENRREILKNCIENKTSVSYNSYLTTKNNTIKWLQSTITPVLDRDSNISKIVAIDADITNLKEAENKIIKKNIEIEEQSNALKKYTEELKLAYNELEIQKNKVEKALSKLKNTQSQLVASEKMASLGLLTSGIAHEINNPVNYISSSIEGLRNLLNDIKTLLQEYESISSDNFTEKIRLINKIKEDIDYVDLIKGFGELTSNIKMGIDKTKEIVNSLRTFSRVDDHSFTLSDINSCLDSTLVLLGNQTKERITIIKNYEEIPKIECIEGKINQVFMNILMNSIQAIKNKGEIKIGTGFSKKNGNNHIEITISDTGVGMSEEVQKKIFEPFFTTKNVGEGTGLGLSITYSIIKKHNGNIEVSSKPYKGTKFTITLPINQK